MPVFSEKSESDNPPPALAAFLDFPAIRPIFLDRSQNETPKTRRHCYNHSVS